MTDIALAQGEEVSGSWPTAANTHDFWQQRVHMSLHCWCQPIVAARQIRAQ
jgi:hypothetical protein